MCFRRSPRWSRKSPTLDSSSTKFTRASSGSVVSDIPARGGTFPPRPQNAIHKKRDRLQTRRRVVSEAILTAHPEEATDGLGEAYVCLREFQQDFEAGVLASCGSGVLKIRSLLSTPLNLHDLDPRSNRGQNTSAVLRKQKKNIARNRFFNSLENSVGRNICEKIHSADNAHLEASRRGLDGRIRDELVDGLYFEDA